MKNEYKIYKSKNINCKYNIIFGIVVLYYMIAKTINKNYSVDCLYNSKAKSVFVVYEKSNKK